MALEVRRHDIRRDNGADGRIPAEIGADKSTVPIERHCVGSVSMQPSDEELVDAIYAGMASPALLEHALMMALSRLGANGGNFHIVAKQDLRSALFLGRGANYSPGNINAYLSHWRHLNVHRQLMRSRGALTPDGVFVCHEHMDDETVSTSAYLNEFYFPMGERWLAGAVAYDDADYEVSLAFNRSRGQAPFGPEERRLIASMLPHVRRAASLALSMAKEAGTRGFAESLEATDQAAFLLDGARRVLWRNAAGEALLSRGGALALRGSRLELEASDADERLGGLVSAALARSLATSSTERLRVTDAEACFALEVLPASLPRGGVFGVESAALVIVREIRLDAKLAEGLRGRFGLTKAESQLALALAEGRSVEEVADKRCRSETTLRAQLREIFSKTGVTRQGALIAKIWRMGA